MKSVFTILLFLPFICAAQLTLEGRVIDEITSKPIPDASVFLSNTTIGTKSAADGSFKIYVSNAGQYDLIITVIGYEGFQKTLMIDGNLKVSDIKILPKTILLNDIIIVGKDDKRAKKLRLFTEQFLGSSFLANQCKILNPEILELQFAKKEKQLFAKTSDFLEIENIALGYKLKYLLSDFILDAEAGTVSYEGSVLFEEMEGTPSQQSRWGKTRLEVYFGSSTHFLRQLLANQMSSNYLVRNFCIKSVNVERDNKLLFDTLRPKDFVHPTDRRGIFAMSYNDQIDVFHYPSKYTQRMGEGLVVTMTFLEPNVFFDSNGVILNRKGVLFRNAWGKSRIAELLPIDFKPSVEEYSESKKVEQPQSVSPKFRRAIGRF